MARCHPILDLQAFIEKRYAAARRSHPEWSTKPPCVHPALTAREAEWFLRTVVSQGGKPPLFEVTHGNRHVSGRYPPNTGGAAKNYTFFWSPGGTLPPETIVHQAAMWRLHSEFGWPLDHLVFQSPDVSDVLDEDGKPFRREAVDILLLRKSCSKLDSAMTKRTARSRVIVEAKADKRELDTLIAEMRACQGGSHGQHKKCKALKVFGRSLFLGVAAGEDWRLFPVVRRDGRAFLGKQLRDLDRLHFA